MSRWDTALAELRERAATARRFRERAQEWPVDETHTRRTVLALTYVAETDYLRAAVRLLRRHLAGARPPRRLPARGPWPRPLRTAWHEHVLHRHGACGGRGGIWRSIPGPDLLAQVEQREDEDPLWADVAEGLRGLETSLRGRRDHDLPQQVLAPAGAGGSHPGGPVRRWTLPLLGQRRSHRLYLAFAGSGQRVEPGREDEHRRLHADMFAVHDRVTGFSAAVERLLERAHGEAPDADEASGAASQRARGVARYLGRERDLAPPREPLPRHTPRAHWGALAGLIALYLALAATGATWAMESHWLIDHPGPAKWALAGGMAASGLVVGLPFRALLRRPPRTALTVAVSAFVAAAVIWKLHTPVVNHFFQDPLERYERQYACLAASPYHRDRSQTRIENGVLTVHPLRGGSTDLRLGPARDGGTDPLQPRDDATRAALAHYGCPT